MITHFEKSTYHQLLISLFLAFFFSTNTTTAIENRIIHFPHDRSIGELYVENRDFPFFSESLGQAKGDVKVPADKAVRLNVSEDAWHGGMPFAGLKADDIQMLYFWECPDADDSVLEDVSTLSGLEELDLQRTKILGTGLRHLGKLKNLKWLRLSSTHVGDDELAWLVGLTSLESLNLSWAPISNAGMKHIGKIKTLKSLYIAKTSVDDDGLEHIKNLTYLHTLDLGQNYITDEGLKQLAGLTELEDLDLRETQISSAGMVHLQHMKKLKRLILDNTKVGDEGLEYLKHLESLENLSLPIHLYTNDKALVTDAGMVYLSELKALKRLSILNDSITEEGVEALAKIKSLECLSIGGKNIDDACMAKLAELPSLKELWIQHCSVTDEGLAELKNLKSLTTLVLGNIPITGKGLAFIQELPSLVEIRLHSLNLGPTGLSGLAGTTSLEDLELNIEIKDEDLAGMPELKNLKRLNILSDTISDEGIRHLAKLKSLENLSLNSPGITNAGLVYLEGLDLLKNLNLRDTKVTEEGLQRLKKTLPALHWHLDQDSSSIQASSLVGKPLLQLKDFRLNPSLLESKEKNILVCFFDMNQRPSRNCLLQLSKRAQELKAKDVVVAAVQIPKANEEKLYEWIKNSNIQFPVGMVRDDDDRIRFIWGVQSLPWLILTDKEHIIRAEGFSISELDEKILILTENKQLF